MALLRRGKVRNYRMHNEICALINTYYKDDEIDKGTLIPVESFIEAKETEFCVIHGVDRIELDQKLLNKFHKRVSLKGDKFDDNYYHFAGMLSIWRIERRAIGGRWLCLLLWLI